MPQDIVSATEAAEALGQSKQNFCRWIREKKIQPDFVSRGGAFFRPKTVQFIGAVLDGVGRSAVHDGRLA